MEKYIEGLKLLEKGKINEALQTFEASTSNDAKYQIGLIYITKGEIQKGIKALEAVAVLKHPLAAKTLTTIYEKGMGVEASIDKSSLFAKIYAGTGDNESQAFIREIANRYVNDKPSYLKYLQALCEINDLEAIYETAMIIFNEIKDSSKGIDYLKKGADLGSKDCLEMLSSIYKEGLYGTAVNGSEYFNIITKLANDYPEEVKYTDSLVEIYEKGLFGVEKDLEKGLSIIRERASHGYSEAIYEFRLAELKETGRLGVRIDGKEAVTVYQNLLESFPNNPTYQLKMAEIFDEGKFGVSKDSKKALQIYRSLLVRDPENVTYNYKLGVLYSKSSDADEQKQAFTLLEKAFNAGCRMAGYYCVTLNYNGGIRVPKDYLKAVTIAQKVTDIVGNATLDEKEAELFKSMKSLEIQMYENGGAKLPKNPRKAKEVLQAYNDSHKDKIKIGKPKWN